jgi:hypothetical protein
MLPLLTSQKNAVYRFVENYGFDPADFEWRVAVSPQGDDVTVETLQHRSTQYAFTFDTNRRGRGPLGLTPDRLSFMKPGPEQPFAVSEDYGWDEQLRSVGTWLGVLKREVSQESLWDRLSQEPMRAVAVARLDNGRLSKEERRTVEQGVGQAKAYVAANIDDRETLKRIEGKLDEIKDASGRLGRKEFVNAALGALMGIAFMGALTSDQMNAIARLIFSDLPRMLGH